MKPFEERCSRERMEIDRLGLILWHVGGPCPICHVQSFGWDLLWVDEVVFCKLPFQGLRDLFKYPLKSLR